MGTFLELALCCSILVLPTLAWHGSSLPWMVQHHKKPIDEKFYKFWKRSVLDKLLTYDYDSWFRRFILFPPSLQAPVGSKFSCPVIKSQHEPVNVHRLTPGDIKIVAAVGDSTTTGFGARSEGLVDLYVEFRDIAWSIGGRGKLEQVTTLPNILKKFNPLIQGFSTRVTPVSKRKDVGSGNNFAKSGGTAENLSEQVEELISFIKENEGVSFKRDWKLLTIFIGGQDLCLSCYDRDFAVHGFIKKMSHALEKIKEKLPRVLVNLVQIFDVTNFSTMSSSYCKAFLKVTCPCAAGGYRQRAVASRTAKEYSLSLQRLVNSPRFRDTQDFAVVLQPFLSETSFPRNHNGRIDHSYFAPDCFHLSAKGHAAMATALWNNMLQPVGAKTKRWIADEKLNCPRPDFPYFFTKTNSREYTRLRRPMNLRYRQDKGYDIQKGVQASEREHNDASQNAEAEKEARHRALGIAIGSGLGIAAMAVGIVIFLVKRKQNQNGPLAGHGRETSRYYNSLEQETNM